jgi:hypothetical protein
MTILFWKHRQRMQESPWVSGAREHRNLTYCRVVVCLLTLASMTLGARSGLITGESSGSILAGKTSRPFSAFVCIGPGITTADSTDVQREAALERSNSLFVKYVNDKTAPPDRVTKGKLLYEARMTEPVPFAESHDDMLKTGHWRMAKGDWDFHEGGLRGAQVQGENSAIGYLIVPPFKDVIIEFDARVDGASRCIFRINDIHPTKRSGEHVCRVTLTKDGVVAQKDDHDHAGPDKAVPFGKIETLFKPGEWKRIRIQIVGSHMVVTVDEQTVQGSHPLIAREKNNIGFGVTKRSASFRNLRMWEALKPAVQ